MKTFAAGKTLIAGAIVATTMALSMPTPASAIGIVIGPRGVGVRVGRPVYRRPYVGRRPFVRPYRGRGYRRF